MNNVMVTNQGFQSVTVAPNATSGIYNWPFNTTTKATVWPNDMWIGDPPVNPNWWEPDIIPNVLPINPNVQPYYPSYYPVVTTVTAWPSWNAGWRVKYEQGTDVVLSYDVPGVKADDCEVTVSNGWVTFNGKRFDTGMTINSTYCVGQDYDAKTCEAQIEAGVLTVRLSKYKAKRAHSVKVKAL